MDWIDSSIENTGWEARLSMELESGFSSVNSSQVRTKAYTLPDVKPLDDEGLIQMGVGIDSGEMKLGRIGEPPSRVTVERLRETPNSAGVVPLPAPFELFPSLARNTNGRWIRRRSRACRSPRPRWSPPAPIAGLRSLPRPISAYFDCEYGNLPSLAREIAHGSAHS